MKNDNYGNSKASSSPFAAALFGAVVATVATLLMDGNNRRKLRNKINQFLDEGQGKIDEINLQLQDMREKGKKKIASKLRETEEKLEKANVSKATT